MIKWTQAIIFSIAFMAISGAVLAEKIELLCEGTLHQYSDGGSEATLTDEVLIIDLSGGTAKYDGVFGGDFEVSRHSETSIVISSLFETAFGNVSGSINRYSGELFLAPPFDNGKIDIAADLVCKPTRRLF